jgi:predicted lipoprotein with Yx(FWY)xxD motif
MLRSLLVSLILVAACSAGAPPTPSPAPPTGAPTLAPTAAPTAAPTTAPTYAPGASGSPYCDPDTGYSCESPGAGTPAPAGEATVELSDDGTHLVGSNGLSLYVFDNDSPNHTACTGGCAGAWPALTVASGETPSAGEGVTGTLSTFDRGGGVMQVQYNDRPLYFYSGDGAPGDTNGDGINGVWHLATP